MGEAKIANVIEATEATEFEFRPEKQSSAIAGAIPRLRQTNMVHWVDLDPSIVDWTAIPNVSPPSDNSDLIQAIAALLPRLSRATLEHFLEEIDEAAWDEQFAAHPEFMEHLSAQADEQIRLGQVYEIDDLTDLDDLDAE